MIYLDYSATTRVDDRVLETFVKVSKEYIGNPNSLHKLGVESKKIIDASTKQIAGILNIKEQEIIYTSGAVEANNTALYGVVQNYQNRGRKIISSHLEHSSILEGLKYLEKIGYCVEYVKLKDDGSVDLEDLRKKVTKDTVLVTIASVNSEIGLHQNLKDIYTTIKEVNPITIFHSDITQSIGKVKEDLQYVDLASMSAQKFYGLKGIGILVKKENIDILPLIKGGKSTTKYRSGTPSAALIASTAKALRLINENIDRNYDYVEMINKHLKDKLETVPGVFINSNNICIPHILNISVDGIKPETILHALEQEDIYISTRTACSSNASSQAVYDLTKDSDRASTSIRISISKDTTIEEIDSFFNVFIKKVASLRSLS